MRLQVDWDEKDHRSDLSSTLDWRIRWRIGLKSLIEAVPIASKRNDSGDLLQFDAFLNSVENAFLKGSRGNNVRAACAACMNPTVTFETLDLFSFSLVRFPVLHPLSSKELRMNPPVTRHVWDIGSFIFSLARFPRNTHPSVRPVYQWLCILEHHETRRPRRPRRN